MAMRLQELHPSLVHLPITLLPASILSDLLGWSSGSGALLELGRRLMPIAAASAGLAGIAGLIAQEASEVPERARPLLRTHRNLNLGLVGVGVWMAARRTRRRRPGAPYLLAGLGVLGAMAYSAYLGGRMVYEHGVGVAAAGGLKERAAPELQRNTARDVVRTSGSHLRRGVRRALAELPGTAARPPAR